MALYLVSYDIKEKSNEEAKPGYDPFFRQLRALGGVRILYSEWILESHTRTATDLCKDLLPYLGPTDRMLVQELTNNAAWYNLRISNHLYTEFAGSAHPSLSGKLE